MSCGCVAPEVLGHQDGCASLAAIVERSAIAPVGATVRLQGPCPCCGASTSEGGEPGSGGCYAADDLPPNWMDVEPWASQRCRSFTDPDDRAGSQCRCWGGPDLECEDCWLSYK